MPMKMYFVTSREGYYYFFWKHHGSDAHDLSSPLVRNIFSNYNIQSNCCLKISVGNTYSIKTNNPSAIKFIVCSEKNYFDNKNILENCKTFLVNVDEQDLVPIGNGGLYQTSKIHVLKLISDPSRKSGNHTEIHQQIKHYHRQIELFLQKPFESVTIKKTRKRPESFTQFGFLPVYETQGSYLVYPNSMDYVEIKRNNMYKISPDSFNNKKHGFLVYNHIPEYIIEQSLQFSRLNPLNVYFVYFDPKTSLRQPDGSIKTHSIWVSDSVTWKKLGLNDYDVLFDEGKPFYVKTPNFCYVRKDFGKIVYFEKYDLKNNKVMIRDCLYKENNSIFYHYKNYETRDLFATNTNGDVIFSYEHPNNGIFIERYKDRYMVKMLINVCQETIRVEITIQKTGKRSSNQKYKPVGK